MSKQVKLVIDNTFLKALKVAATVVGVCVLIGTLLLIAPMYPIVGLFVVIGIIFITLVWFLWNVNDNNINKPWMFVPWKFEEVDKDE